MKEKIKQRLQKEVHYSLLEFIFIIILVASFAYSEGVISYILAGTLSVFVVLANRNI